ncbi:cytidylate kinase family protein [Thermosipho ferrireducens]|uniref:cytidylate kinase family protein n=1 Tax=Thermosipho ferrireducens TaxID=2571116 RepID=UPI001D18042D|nr:cytidylate kinase family protein [Thermosipho ferrireducens]
MDGVDASGKTTLAEELAKELESSKRPIIRASIDGFHNSKSIRYAKGEDSPEGYYYNSFNYKALVKVLLKPLSSGKLLYKTSVFDYKTDSNVESPFQQAASNSILIMEGVFLFRPELVNYWDIKIFVDADFKVTVERAVKRNTEKDYIGSEQKIRSKYEKRYIPGQQIYFRKASPKEKADIVINNNDFENPLLTKKPI